MIANPACPAPGTEVGCHYRWPYHANHPDCWQPPHKGIVLALDDPRAWSETLAFPRMNPTQEECTAHVQNALERGLIKDSVPVLWNWIDGTQGVQWDSNLRPYAEELAAWEKARENEYRLRNTLATAYDVKKEWGEAEKSFGKFLNLDQETLDHLTGCSLYMLSNAVRAVFRNKQP